MPPTAERSTVNGCATIGRAFVRSSARSLWGQSCHRRCMNQRGRAAQTGRVAGAEPGVARRCTLLKLLPRVVFLPSHLGSLGSVISCVVARLHARDTTQRQARGIQQLFAAIWHFHAQHFHNSNLHTKWQFGPKKRLLRQPSCSCLPVAGGKTTAGRGRRLIELKHSIRIRVSSNERQLKMHHKRPQRHFINAALIYALNAEEQQASSHSCDWAIKQSTKAAQEPEMLTEPVPEPALEPFARQAYARANGCVAVLRRRLWRLFHLRDDWQLDS